MKMILFFVKLSFIFYIIFYKRKNSGVTMGWSLLFWEFPIAAVILYLLIGQEIPKKNPGTEGENVGRVTEDNRITVFTTGEDKFESLLKDIRQAKKEILIQYYIIKNDFLFETIQELLVKKTQEGVSVRILYDVLGSRSIKKERWKRLQSAGISVRGFKAPFFRRFFLRFNYRNHRKIVVIDYHIGYFGGYNIGREYLGMEPKFGYWRDTHLKLTGSSVSSLRAVFLKDWGEAEGEFPKEGGSKGSMVQMITSGPDSQAPHIRNAMLRLIALTEKSIWIQTPYFVPDDPVLTALKLALLSGKEVRLMIPCMPDHMFVYWATRYFAGELLEAGAKVYIYERGFLHAKGIIIDDKAYCYGTANMDIRSFHLNYEINGIIYDLEETEKMKQIFEEDICHCRMLTYEEYQRRGFVIRIKEQFSRLFSPLL